ncbi:putative MFS family arabinose efflux permease [Saccharopolyspora erythraea NRRL 2338]|uniref:MFS transporter n=2 Tax=Saccharopolyspora erythraea TaxID=1836 RepID=A0ABN1D0Q9_SACER|nr:MFS transporter [Saccharopolyspora erythraea]EQD87685.1 major facilitator transporter [Saccharopolyspora erythraea D]PFG92959.1 putative MFS family arabinose efflux permease [Saccharopolyspora erythraea NRRL 2338]QRK89853.1 MFS transporter [Saccharopolyspora erythraea]CAM06356.1 probable multidrug resistance protein [Saccharopolyspora erythraea NRRL 2338]
MTTQELAPTPGRSTAAPPRRLPRSLSFWLVGGILCVFLMASTAPSPMYSIYQQRWGFTTTVLTEVFAVYAVAILVSLIMFGSLSDHVGRRPVLLVSLLVEIVSVIVLATAPAVGWLYLGRILQGLATGAATSAVSGALLDFQPPGTNRGPLINGVSASLGMALGSLMAGALVQYAPGPTTLSYVVILIGLAAAVPAVLAMPERVTGSGRTWRELLRPQRPTVPAGRGRDFALLATTMLAAWTVGGMYMSLGPSVAKGMVSGAPYLVGGLAVATLAGVGGLAQLVFSGWPGRRAVLVATPLLIASLAGVATSVVASSPVLFFAASIVLGVGWGMMFMGGFRLLTAMATPEHRAGTSAMIYVVAYLSAGVPSVTLGFLTTAFGLTAATVVFAAAAGTFAAVAGISTLARR